MWLLSVDMAGLFNEVTVLAQTTGRVKQIKYAEWQLVKVLPQLGQNLVCLKVEYNKLPEKILRRCTARAGTGLAEQGTGELLTPCTSKLDAMEKVERV